MKVYSRNSKSRRRNLRPGLWTLLRMAGLLVAVSGFIALADQLCFNNVTGPGAPPNFGKPPLIDGSVLSGDTRCFNPSPMPPCTGPDLGWTNSFSYIFNNPDGPVNPDVTVQGIKDATHLYINVQVNNSTPTGGGSTDPNNVVVIAFDPDNSGTKMQFLVISPALGGTNGKNQNAQFVDYYWNQTSVASPSTAATNYIRNPTWLPGAGGNVNTPCSTPGTTCIQSDLEGAQWTMEMALPLVVPSGDPSTGLILPATGHFGMYIDVLRIVNGMWSQAPWPSNAPMTGCTTPLVSCQLTTPPVTSIPATTSWGTGTIDPNPSPACTGIYVGSQGTDVTVTNSLYGTGDAIDGSHANTFNALVHNTGSTAVPNLVINFFIANFGLPSEWALVGTSQPTTGSNVPAGATTTLHSNAWTPPNPSNYTGANAHQCILATLSANPPNSTYFVNTNAVQNMNVFDASRVERPVQVSSKGYTVNPKHTTEQEFDINVITRMSTINPCGTTPNGSTRTPAAVNCNPVAQMIETAEACRHTGMYLLNASKQPIELCQGVGSFGFVAKHAGTVNQWTYGLTGPGLTGSPKDGKYHLRMPNNSVVNLNNVVEANPVGGCTHLFGFAIPGLLIAGILAIGLMVYRPRERIL